MQHQLPSDSNASPVTRHPSPPVHCLTFDIEEHFQVSAFDSPMRRRHWDQFESRVERNTEKLLELLATEQIRATFFVLGWVAERHADLVRRIARQGHEVASHGYAHELVTTQTSAQFRDDVREAKAILEDLIGESVLGYRAPSFTITPDTLWAFNILVEEGYVYDSSVVPISRGLHDRYGMPGADPWVHEVATEAGVIWEVPPSTVSLGGFRIPIAGGGYFRLFPYCLLRHLLGRVQTQGQPLVMYLHPWELDPDQPRMNGSRLSRFRQYVNLHKTEERLVSLLHEFAFGPIRETIQSIRELDATRARSTQPQSRADRRCTPAKEPGRVRKVQVGSPSRSQPSASSAQNIEVI